VAENHNGQLKASSGKVKPSDRHSNWTMLILAQIHLFLFTAQSSLEMNVIHRKERRCRSFVAKADSDRNTNSKE